MDHYHTLQVGRHAEAEVIEKAYKALCLKYHPDRQAPGKRKAATAKMQAINEAYAVLSDPRRRRGYDRSLPAVDAQPWERFMDQGLVGLFQDWVRTRP